MESLREVRRGRHPEVSSPRLWGQSLSYALDMMAGMLLGACASIDGRTTYRRLRHASWHGMRRNRRCGCSLCPKPTHCQVVAAQEKGSVAKEIIRTRKHDMSRRWRRLSGEIFGAGSSSSSFSAKSAALRLVPTLLQINLYNKIL